MVSLANMNPLIFDKLMASVKNMHTTYKTLSEKVKNLEDRMSMMDKENEVTVDSDMKTCEDQFKLIDERIAGNKDMIDSNKDALTKIEVDIEDIKSNKKDESSKQSVVQEHDQKRCKWWNRGYCKFKQKCPFLHPKEICIEEKCVDKDCQKRHPNNCKNWEKGECKFTGFCEFKHLNVENKSEDVAVQNLDDAFVDYDNINSDEDEFENKNEKSESCDKCDFITTNKMHLKLHDKSCHKKVMKINESVKNNEDYPVHKTDNFVDHDNFDSDDDEDEITKKYTCDQCDYSSEIKGNVTKHIKTVHKKDDSKVLKRKRESNNSSSSKKTKEGTFSCDKCEFKSNTKKYLTKHKETSCVTKLV